VLPAVSESTAATQSVPIHALELAHALAFRNGLGHSLYTDSHATGNITAEDIRDLRAGYPSVPGSTLPKTLAINLNGQISTTMPPTHMTTSTHLVRLVRILAES
jgi:hypothetical protein